MFVEKKGMKIYFEKHGDKQPLMMMHGLARDHETWLPYLDFLTQHFQLILPDGLGSGQTECDHPFTIEEMADAMAAVIEEVGGPIDVMGHSMGGYIAQHLAIRHPHLVKRLGLVATTAHQSPAARLAMETSLEMRKKDVPLHLVAMSFLPMAFSNHVLGQEGAVDKLIENTLGGSFPQSLENFEAQVNACRNHDTRSQLAKIECPTWICAGEKDHLATPEESVVLHQGITNSTFNVIDGAGHVIQVEAPEALFTHMLNMFQ